MSHGLKDNQPASNLLLKSLLGSEATPPGGGAWGGRGPEETGAGHLRASAQGGEEGPDPASPPGSHPPEPRVCKRHSGKRH